MAWRIVFYSARVAKELLSLPAGMLARFVRYAERMELYGLILVCPIRGPWVTGYSSYV